jgi:multidrug efflux system membrane fusion protein
MPEPVDAVARPRRRWLGTLLALLLLLALAALAWYLTHRAAPKPAAGLAMRGAPASTVGTALARRADMPVRLDALGTVTSLAAVTVQPQVTGVLRQIAYSEGQMVKKGDLLAVIDPQPFEIALAQAQAARARDEAQLEAAQVTLHRYRTLLGQDSIARQQVDTQAALVKQLEGSVAIDRANEASAKLNLSWSRIVAPITGKVGLRPVDVGNVVSPGSSGGVAAITQMNPIDVQFALPQDRVPELQERLASGAKLETTAFDRTRTQQLDVGVFSALDNQIDTQTGTVKAKARFPNNAGTLFPNQFVNISLLLRTIPGAIVVPVTAMRHGPNGDYVYVVQEDRTVALRPVTRGEASVNFIVVTSGLTVGERVVTEGGDRLKEGARVQLARAASAPASGASDASGAGGPRRRGAANGASAAARGDGPPTRTAQPPAVGASH